MDDTISRRVAINLLKKWSDGYSYIEVDTNSAIKAFEALPSVQPVITCDGCRFVSTYDTDFPCCSCVRREKDYYAPER